jgi:hypothetical protein
MIGARGSRGRTVQRTGRRRTGSAMQAPSLRGVVWRLETSPPKKKWAAPHQMGETDRTEGSRRQGRERRERGRRVQFTNSLGCYWCGTTTPSANCYRSLTSGPRVTLVCSTSLMTSGALVICCGARRDTGYLPQDTAERRGGRIRAFVRFRVLPVAGAS